MERIPTDELNRMKEWERNRGCVVCLCLDVGKLHDALVAAYAEIDKVQAVLEALTRERNLAEAVCEALANVREIADEYAAWRMSPDCTDWLAARNKMREYERRLDEAKLKGEAALDAWAAAKKGTP